MKYRKVVFIDPATIFGWAMQSDITPGIEQITSGAVVLPSEPGPRVKAFWLQLEQMFFPNLINIPYGEFTRRLEYNRLSDKPEETFFAWEEAAFSWHGAAQSRMYGTWEGLLLLFCEMHKIPYCTVNQATIKAYAQKQGLFTPRKPRPRWHKGEKPVEHIRRIEAWAITPFDAKPRPRPEWKLTSAAKIQNNECDARWGLEYILKQLETE